MIFGDNSIAHDPLSGTSYVTIPAESSSDIEIESSQSTTFTFVVSAISGLEITDSHTVTVTLTVEAISALGISDSHSALANLVVEAISSLGISTVGFATIGDVPALDSSSQVWVINQETGASSQYEQYGFHDWFEEDGVCYGVADDGIYQLDGDDDDGSDIDAFIDYGNSNFGSLERKQITKLFVSAKSDSKVIVKVIADGTEYTFEALRNNATVLEKHACRTNRKMLGNYLNFKVYNQDGSEIDLDNVEFEKVNVPGRYR